MRNKVLLILIILFIYRNSYSLDSIKKNIDIGIIINTSAFTTGCSKNFVIIDALNKKLKLSKGTVKVSYTEKGIYADKYLLALPVKIEPSNGIIFAESKPYKGYLTVKKSGDKLNVINVLNIEDYLKGVLPKEVDADWKVEALKAQGVISRTYTISNLNKHSAQGFDLCSTTHCQVYGGAGVEVDACNKAVLATKSEFLTYKGKFANTVFHANCGGHTENPQYIWNWKDIPPYLKGVKCDYCKDAPYTSWEQVLDESFIRKKLSNNNIGKIKKIKVKGKTAAGSAKELEILHSRGKLTLNAYQFRLAVDAWQIKSHFFNSIKKDGDKFYFKGGGWGHKVGLCQWGAKVMAEKGKNYKNILYYFYPGTKITRLTYKQ
ncbi:MAG: SpoIID/LytB domain-containing protein [Endomicrobium sp.]|jgi:stage II sporulation protein D|nr:SpoIID/LytB domain-containing protein [Endomicrobium sp.]